MNTPNQIECESRDLDETRVKLVERGLRIVNQERTAGGWLLTVEECPCDCCRLARGERLSSETSGEQS